MHICPTVGGGSSVDHKPYYTNAVSNMLNTHVTVLVSIKHVEYARYTVISSITFSMEFSYYTLDVVVTSCGISQPTILAGSSWILCTGITARQRLRSVALCFCRYIFYSFTIYDTTTRCLASTTVGDIAVICSVLLCIVLCCSVLLLYYGCILCWCYN